MGLVAGKGRDDLAEDADSENIFLFFFTAAYKYFPCVLLFGEKMVKKKAKKKGKKK